jgi:hypothetical protein
MKLRRLLLIAAAAAVLTTAGAGVAMAGPHGGGGPGHHDGDHPGDHHGDRGHWGERGWHGDSDWHGGDWRGDHDRYWRHEYGGRHYVDRDRIFWGLRRHHYDRFLGDPMWYGGRYVVRTYDRFGNLVFVEIDPYTGDVIGVVNF